METEPIPMIQPNYESDTSYCKEIFDAVFKITALIPDNDEYLNEVKACMLIDAALLTVKVAGAEAGEYRLLFIDWVAGFHMAVHEAGHAFVQVF